MQTVKFILEKEFRQIFRNPAILRMILAMPMIQLIILPFAADFEMKNINLAVIDHDHSAYSRRLVDKIGASGYFQLQAMSPSFAEGMSHMDENKIDVLLEIPANFERDLTREDEAGIAIYANAINGVKGGLGAQYAGQIIGQFNSDIRQEWLQWPRLSPMAQVEVRPRFWYNPDFNYQLYMVPGILALLVTMIASFLSAMNIVFEKETGTIEQINVTPVSKLHFILGKLIPFWVLGMISLTLGFVVSWVIHGIWPVGHFVVMYAFSAIYLIAILGFGLLLSSFADNQQQATFISFFFIMVFVLLSGLFTPAESMPDWAKILNQLNPVTYMIIVMRAVIIKGSGFADLAPNFLIMVGFGVVFVTLAIYRYRKVA